MPLVVAVALLLGACNYLPPLPPNPFAVTPTVVAEATPAVILVTPTTVLTATPVPFAPYWVKNHRPTEMWSGPPGQAGVISFGTTSGQFCSFQVVQPQSGPRLYALNPYSNGHFWIDADAVGPVAEAPQRATGPKPADQNCAEQLYDG